MLTFYLGKAKKKDNKLKFEKIYLHYQKDMYVTAYGILQNKEHAEDVVQDAFVLIMNNLDKIGDIYAKTTVNYIRTIVKNRAFQIYNQLKRKEFLTEEYNFFDYLPDPFQNIEEQLERKELADMIEHMILELPDKYRDVIYLYYYNEMSFTAIAKILDITEANARQLARRARKFLEEKLLKENILEKEEFERRPQYE